MICILQARMSSKRLKGKIMKKLSGKTIISRVVKQIQKSKKIKKIIIATSTKKEDDLIEKFCKKNKLIFYRGSLENVALRFLHIQKKFNLKSFVRINCDSPLINPKLIDKLINKYNEGDYDIVTNIFPRSFPKGQSVEVIKSKTFLKAYSLFKKKHFEHVTNFFYDNYKKFKIFNLLSSKNFSDLRLCVDTKSDLKRLRELLKDKNYLNLNLSKRFEEFKRII